MRIYLVLGLLLAIVSIGFSRSIPVPLDDDDTDQVEDGSDQRGLDDVLLLARLRNMLDNDDSANPLDQSDENDDEEESAENLRKKRQIDDEDEDDDDDDDDDVANDAVKTIPRNRLEDLQRALQGADDDDDDDEQRLPGDDDEADQVRGRNGPGRMFEVDDDDDVPASTTTQAANEFEDDDD